MEVHRDCRDIVFKIRFASVALLICINNQVPLIVECPLGYEISSNDVFLGFRAFEKIHAAVWASDVLQWPASKDRVGNLGGVH